MTVQEMLREFVNAQKYGKNDIFSKQDIIDWFKKKYPDTKLATLNCQITAASTNNKNRIHYGATEKYDLLYRLNSNSYRLYSPDEDDPPIYKWNFQAADGKNENVAIMDAINDEQDQEVTREFAYENDLKMFLSKNLDIIGPKLRLFQDAESNISGLEVSAGSRKMDMLLLDDQNNYIVIELKVSNTYDKVLGQILRYMGWVRQNFADPGQNVRGIIIGRKISEDLIIASSEVRNVTLMEYSIDVKLKPIN